MASIRQTRRSGRGWSLAFHWRIVTGAFMVICAVTTCAAGDESVDIVRDYLSAWQRADTKHMYELLASDAKREVTLDEFVAAFTVRLPFADEAEAYVLRPVRFDKVRLRPGSVGTIDYRAVFTVESLLGPAGCHIFCGERRASLTLPELRRARLRALYLLYDQGRSQSRYVSISYVLRLWVTLVLEDLLSFLPSDAPPQSYTGVLPRVGLEADWELVVDTANTTMKPWNVCAASTPFLLAAFQVTKDGRISLPLVRQQRVSLPELTLEEQDFARLIWLMGLDDG